jgi:hypothetical protein
VNLTFRHDSACMHGKMMKQNARAQLLGQVAGVAHNQQAQLVAHTVDPAMYLRLLSSASKIMPSVENPATSEGRSGTGRSAFVAPTPL